MLNRTEKNVSEALDTRRAITAGLRDHVQELPATPFDWSAFDPAAAEIQLAAMTKLLCTAPARSAELRAMWTECVTTAEFAFRLAPILGADANSSAIASLLHRLGDLLTLRAIGHVEHALRLRLDAVSKTDLCAQFGPELLERTVRAWGVPARAAATAAEWRRLREFPSAAAEATVVYLARLFAIERLTPQFCAPGLIEHACEEAGLDVGAVATLRENFRELRSTTENAGQGPASVSKRV